MAGYTHSVSDLPKHADEDLKTKCFTVTVK